MLLRSIAQLPARYQAGHGLGDDPAAVLHPILMRAGSAGATKTFLAELERAISASRSASPWTARPGN